MTSLKGKDNPAYKHGFARRGKRSNMYRRWQHMIQKCYNPNDSDYAAYGGRGIQVCPQWRESFFCFLSDMGTPGANATLDRLDNNGPYSKENCHWASPKQQANNRSNTVRLTIRGVTLPLSDWCHTAGIGPKTVLYRLKHTNMTHEEAVFTLPDKTRKNK